jgi:hypothetical protein
MIYPEIRSIISPDLDPPAMPPDPFDCEIRFDIVIAPKDGEPGEEAFSFVVITPARLAQNPEPSWGRGKLILPAFDWTATIHGIAQLLAECARPTWNEAVRELSRSMIWEITPPDA